MTDPIADMLTRIRNGYRAKRKTVVVPYSRLKKQLADVLVKESFVENVTHEEENRILTLRLIYDDETPRVSHIKRLSKPGLRRYVGSNEIPRVLGGLGVVILSTPQGLLTGKEARKAGVGGELMCQIW